jgi:hypothetical protein
MQEEEQEEIFPAGDDKIPQEAKDFMDRHKRARTEINALIDEVGRESFKYSQDILFWADFQMGIKMFEPWMKQAEERKAQGLAKPSNLSEVGQILNESKASSNFKSTNDIFASIFHFILLTDRHFLRNVNAD